MRRWLFATCVLFACHRDDIAPTVQRGALDAGDAAAPSPVQRPLDAPTSGYTTFVLTDSAACAVHGSGRVACWGDRAIGLGTEWLSTKTPAWVPGLTDVALLFSGGNAVCAEKVSGEVSCWGLGAWGKDKNGYAFEPTRAPHLDGMRRIALGSGLDTQHGCGVTPGGDAQCWGLSGRGQVALTSDGGHVYYSPRDVLRSVKDVAIAPSHSCALTTGGDVMCWGSGEHGTLGDGDAHERDCRTVDAPSSDGMRPGPRVQRCDRPDAMMAPTRVLLSGKAVALSQNAACATVLPSDAGASPAVQCWGPGYAPTPSYRLSGDAARELVAIDGASEHTCALARGQVWCWGRPTSGQLAYATPTRIAALDGATQVAARKLRMCALVPGGAVRCQGLNASAVALDDWTAR